MIWMTQGNVCPGLFYGTPAQDGFLIRLRLPGGIIEPPQGEAIAHLLQQGDLEGIQVTNRANLQIRAVTTAPSAELLQKLQNLGLASRNPKVDHLRNLMASPTAGIDTQELIDTRPLVRQLDTYIQTHPELERLPAKFSIGVDAGGKVGIGIRSALAWEHRYNEIQLSALEIEGIVYLHLALGAEKGLSETEIIIKPEHCLSLVGTLTRVYLDYIQQKPASDKVRLKHLLQNWGQEKYLEQVKSQLCCPILTLPALTSLPPTQSYGHLGVHPQKQGGLSYLGVSLPLGYVTRQQWSQLVKLSETFGRGYLRLTPWQSLLIPHIPDRKVAEILKYLADLGLSASPAQPDAALVACTGKPGCAAALTQTQKHARELRDYLQQNLTLTRPVNIHLTACPKSCAQGSPAEIKLLGITMEENSEPVEGYSIYVGGHHLRDLAFTEIPPLLTQLLTLYQDSLHATSCTTSQKSSTSPPTSHFPLARHSN